MSFNAVGVSEILLPQGEEHCANSSFVMSCKNTVANYTGSRLKRVRLQRVPGYNKLFFLSEKNTSHGH